MARRCSIGECLYSLKGALGRRVFGSTEGRRSCVDGRVVELVAAEMRMDVGVDGIVASFFTSQLCWLTSD